MSEDGTGRDDYPGRRWKNNALRNIEKWDNQEPKVLLLAMAEEMAEIADEPLEDNGLPPNAYGSKADQILNDIRTTGYWAREYLEEQCEDEDGNPLPLSDRPDLSGVANPEAATEETSDLAPLLFQMYWALDDYPVQAGTE